LESGARAPRTRSEHNNYVEQVGGSSLSLSSCLSLPSFSVTMKSIARTVANRAAISWPFLTLRLLAPPSSSSTSTSGDHDSVILIMRQRAPQRKRRSTFDSFPPPRYVVGNGVPRWNREIDACDTRQRVFRDSRDGSFCKLSGYVFTHNGQQLAVFRYSRFVQSTLCETICWYSFITRQNGLTPLSIRIL